MSCPTPGTPRSLVLLQSPSEGDSVASTPDKEKHHLPIMPLNKVKLPQETISLQLFEPRYRLLFKLVKQSNSRKFGLVMADRQQGTMESVGSLCELTHYIPVPERFVIQNPRCITMNAGMSTVKSPCIFMFDMKTGRAL